MLPQLALKNILTFKKRSIITLLLTAISTALLVFASAFMGGSHSTMIRNAVELYPGYLQITGKGFRDTPSLEHIMVDIKPVREILLSQNEIEVFAERFETFVLFSSDEKATGALLAGIEPEKEAHISRLKSSLTEGKYLSNVTTGQLYIGFELAKKLRVGVGDSISYIGTGADYSFAADNLTVVGIFMTGLYEFDGSSAFVPKSYFDSAMASYNMASHIIVQPKFTEGAEQLAQRLTTLLPDEFTAESWQETMSGLVQAMELDSIFGYITLAIIFIVIFFVIMIYTLLGVFTRIREIGVLRAIGTTSNQVFALLVLESTLLTLAGVLLGGVIGGLLAYYFEVHPLYFSGYEDQFKQYGLVQSSLPTDFSPIAILRDMTIMFLLGVGCTIYPIFKILRYNPVEAMRHV
ncbi:FtsX-like permease family protein [Desulfopila sp. IMCC35008]|uniref:ABC transporter permease n=1 Tax=Desulfopila sp. IMCC35008 TaxID=2653858 RepID=UPI0013D458BC|nr:FtsX-like permease family protein [Desulfopila sp. IMCC35008]